jgi:hypothetical protein
MAWGAAVAGRRGFPDGSIRIEGALQARHKFIRTQKNLVLQFLPRLRLIFPVCYESL